MTPELYALSAAVAFSLGQIAVKFATQSGKMVLGFLTTLASGIVAVGTYAMVTVDNWSVPWTAVALFSVAGLAGPGAGRILGIRAVRDAGTSVAVPVRSSTTPLLASAGGILIFGERMGLGRILALLLVVGGIWACVRGGSANREQTLKSLEAGQRDGRSRMAVLLFPVAAGAAYAAADILHKLALSEHGDPVVGSLIGTSAALLVWLAVYAASPQLRGPLRITPSLGWFCLSGLLSAVAQVSLLFALRTGDLSVVAPIAASQPVIVVVLGAVFLRNLEQTRLGTVVGALLVFAGIAYLAVS